MNMTDFSDEYDPGDCVTLPVVRNSSIPPSASFAPVDAPEGTSALPQEPSLRPMLTSTVGFPRESSTSRARMSDMVVME